MKPLRCYLVVAACPLDDVVLSVRHYKRWAMADAVRFAALGQEKLLKYVYKNNDNVDTSEIYHVAVMRHLNGKNTIVHIEDVPE